MAHRDSSLTVLDAALAISRAHFALVALMEAVHGEGAFSSGRRALLMNLRDLGPQTVPRLADMRPVSRQYVQKLIDGLRAEGLVEARPNPAHRRSPYHALTEAGAAHVAAMEAREAPVLARLAARLDPKQALVATAFLVTARTAIEEETTGMSSEAQPIPPPGSPVRP